MDFTHIYQTKGIYRACKQDETFCKEIINALSRYLTFDWGDTCLPDKRLNDAAVHSGNDRIVAKYHTSKGNILS